MPRSWLQYVLLGQVVLLLLYFLIPGPTIDSKIDSVLGHAKPEHDKADLDDLIADLKHSDASIPPGELRTDIEYHEQHDAAPPVEPVVELTPAAVVERPKTPYQYPKTQYVTNPYGSDFLERQHKNYSRTLVVSSIKKDTMGWIRNGLSDITDLQLAIYVADDPEAPLTIPANKGNEAMVYLTYIIDHYDILPDVAIFVHAHGEDGNAWHNEEMLNGYGVSMIHQFNTEKAIRDGYINLRCYHETNCIDGTVYAHTVFDSNPWQSHKGLLLADNWDKLFPQESMPEQFINAQGGQFAVSQEAIRQRTKAEYEVLRNFLLQTELDNWHSGRIFEWIWQYVFTRNPIDCPNRLLCLCDTYSICFENGADMGAYDNMVKAWFAMGGSPRALPSHPEDDAGLSDLLGDAIQRLTFQMKKAREEAIEIGKDELKRQKILYAEWEIVKEDSDKPFWGEPT